MGDFTRALQQAEQELMDGADVEAARRRVASRLMQRTRPSVVERLAVPAFALAMCAACVAFGFWLGTPSEGEGAVAVVADAPKPGGGIPELRAPSPVEASMGQLLAEQEGGTCDFSIDGRSHGTSVALDLPLVIGDYDVVCKRGLQSQHQRVRIVARKTTRVVFQFAENVVEELDPFEDPSEEAVTTGEVGTLVAIAIGGSCLFTVDGKAAGQKSSLRRKVPIGAHTVTCKTLKNLKTQTVVVATDKPGIASFKIGMGDSPLAAPPTPPAPRGGVLNPWGNKTPGF